MVSVSFDRLVGQETAIALLNRAVAQERIAPAYLFAGPDGVGRRLAAEQLVELLFSQSPSPARSEDTDTLRRRIHQRNHPDLLWVEPTYLHQGNLLTVAEAQEKGHYPQKPSSNSFRPGAADCSVSQSSPPGSSPGHGGDGSGPDHGRGGS